MLCDVLTGCQTLDQAAVEFPPGGIVDITDICIWLVESGITDQPFEYYGPFCSSKPELEQHHSG